jgi:hypothetical protein
VKSILYAAILVAAGLGFAGWCARREARKNQLSSNERGVDSVLRFLKHLQADYWTQDLDQNGEGSFWQGDVAGLVSLRLSLGPKSFPVSESSRADEYLQELLKSDPSLPGARPYRGFWYIAVRKESDGTSLGKHRFAFCAYPADYDVTGCWTYIVTDERHPTGRNLNGAPVLQLPTPEELRLVWPSCISG